MSRAAALQAMLSSACLSRRAGFDDDLGAFLAAHGVRAEDAAAILAAPRRLGLYRRLVRNNVIGVIDTMLERTRRRFDAVARGAFDRAISDFLEERGPMTPHLRDVPSEFLAFAAPRWRADGSLPPWLSDHAKLELVDFTVGVAPRPEPLSVELAEVSADRPLVFSEPRELVRLAWAVHDMAPDDADAAPSERPVALLVYRDAEHTTRFLDLSPLAAAILERLLRGEPLGAAMASACEAEQQALDDSVLAGAAHLLADLGERGVLLGARG